jgi:Zn-dependent protease with chaperone function
MVSSNKVTTQVPVLRCLRRRGRGEKILNESTTRQRFPGLAATAMQHPDDLAALQTLQRVPGLDLVYRKFLELGLEKVAYIQNIGTNVRISARQCPRIYRLLQEACAILDVPKPELYLMHNPVANALTSGHDHPFIMVTSGMVDLMSEEELLAVLGHELGHIKCGHVLYKMMARGIGALITIVSEATLGLGKVIGTGLVSAFQEWDRKSEFTGDRAGLLTVQNVDTMVSLLVKLAGGTVLAHDEFSAQEFLSQADRYEEVDINLLDRVYKMLLVAQRSHPLAVVRARDITRWAETPTYRQTLAGSYARQGARPTNGRSAEARAERQGAAPEPATYCPTCGEAQTNRYYCSVCGAPLDW